MCGFSSLTAKSETIFAEDLISQFEQVFTNFTARSDEIQEVDLFNSGSFLSNEEMPPSVRAHVFGRLTKLNISRIVIESRPEYINIESLSEAKILPPGVLEVGIGLESADDYIREVMIRKGFGRGIFEQAVEILARFGSKLLVNVLLKPPGITDDASAIADAIETGRYVAALSKRIGIPARVALQPVFVAPGTWLEKEFLAGRYRPPTLWSVVQTIFGLQPLIDTSVGISNEGLNPHLSPSGCEHCDKLLRQALLEFNRTRNLAVFLNINCSCKPKNF